MAGVFRGTVQLRHGTAASWTSTNPVLLLGEAGVETDTGRVKYGDGSRRWTFLTYAAMESGNLDGGLPNTTYGGTTPLDGGGP
jgi:hypothetical protein